MNPSSYGQWGAFALLLFLTLSPDCTEGQETGECFDRFKNGREDFVLDADESVKDGATFISSPKLDRYRDCVASCCKEPRCNVAFMQRGAEEGMIESCFLFDCLYKKKYACRFVRKKGYINYILDSVYDSYLELDVVPSKRQFTRFINSSDVHMNYFSLLIQITACSEGEILFINHSLFPFTQTCSR